MCIICNVRDIKYKFLIFISLCAPCVCVGMAVAVLRRPSPRYAKERRVNSILLFFYSAHRLCSFSAFSNTEGQIQLQRRSMAAAGAQTHSIKYYTNLFSLIFHSNSKSS